MSLEVLNSPRRIATGCAGCNALLLVITVGAIVVPGSVLFSKSPATTRAENEDVVRATRDPIQRRPSPDLDGAVPLTLASLREDSGEADDGPVRARRPFDPPPGIEWTSLFNGEDLTGWTVTDFGGQGPVDVVDGALHLSFGQSMTGVTIAEEVEIPKINYEVQLAAQRVDGSDFFVGLTFPVQDDPCSLILGGWGGGVCGLSSLDFLDASENETTSYREFEQARWYHIRLRVQEHRIDAWIDGKQIVKQRVVGRKIGIRPEVHLSVPFGLATYETTGAIKDLRIRPLAESEIEQE